MNQDPKDFQDIKDNIMIVKARFKASSLNLYGQFILIFKNSNTFDTFNAVVSTYSDLYNLEPHDEWMKYREYIANVKWRGNYNATMTTSMMEHFKKFSEEMNSVSLLYDNVCDYDYKAMDITLYDLVNRIIHDKNLVLETAIQEITPQDYRSSTEATDQKNGSEDGAASYEGFEVDEDAVILPVKPIVSPVKGKPLYELRIGDKLMVYLQPQSDRANYYIDMLDLREKGEIKPTPGEIVDIKAGIGKNNPTDILLQVSPGIYGKFTEIEKQVKLRTYNPETDAPMARQKIAGGAGADNPSPGASGPPLSKGALIMLGLFFMILILFIILIFLTW